MSKCLKILAMCAAGLSFSGSYAMEARLSGDHDRTGQPVLVGVGENQSGERCFELLKKALIAEQNDLIAEQNDLIAEQNGLIAERKNLIALNNYYKRKLEETEKMEEKRNIDTGNIAQGEDQKRYRKKFCVNHFISASNHSTCR